MRIGKSYRVVQKGTKKEADQGTQTKGLPGPGPPHPGKTQRALKRGDSVRRNLGTITDSQAGHTDEDDKNARSSGHTQSVSHNWDDRQGQTKEETTQKV